MAGSCRRSLAGRSTSGSSATWTSSRPSACRSSGASPARWWVREPSGSGRPSPAGSRSASSGSRCSARCSSVPPGMRDSFARLVAPYRVTHGKRFHLRDVSPDDTGSFSSEEKDDAKDMLRRGIERLAERQEQLYAQDRWAVLLIFQAMDAAGKDGTLAHVMSGVNPQGCEVQSFKVPSAEELDHDFLWRCARRLPERGRIGIFNRSYYEEVLVVRVHPELLERQQLPGSLEGKQIWEDRFESINCLERQLARNG